MPHCQYPTARKRGPDRVPPRTAVSVDNIWKGTKKRKVAYLHFLFVSIFRFSFNLIEFVHEEQDRNAQSIIIRPGIAPATFEDSSVVFSASLLDFALLIWGFSPL